MRSGKCSRTRPGSSTLPTAMPASARSDPANSAVVPGTRDRISWPVISASRVSTTVRVRSDARGRHRGRQAHHRERQRRQRQQHPGGGGGQAGGGSEFRNDGAERVDHRPQVDRQQQDRCPDQPSRRFTGRLGHPACIGVLGGPPTGRVHGPSGSEPFRRPGPCSSSADRETSRFDGAGRRAGSDRPGRARTRRANRGTLIAMTTIAILGAGKIGEAMLAGLLGAGRSPESLLFTERYPERVAELTARYGVRGVDTDEAAAVADVLIVAVKPQDIDPLLHSLSRSIKPGTLVVSLCAGLPTALYERHLPAGTPVVRVMPNTPMLVGEAMSAISAGSHAQPEHLQLVEDLLSTVGKVVRVPEAQQDAVTALSGSGPAYFFYLVEAMIDAGILLGLPRDVSTELIIQSAVGAARMLRETGEHPVALREAVTSPGGTTIAAIRELENHAVRAALLSAIEAAALRSAELGKSHNGA